MWQENEYMSKIHLQNKSQSLFLSLTTFELEFKFFQHTFEFLP